ncbi:MAG: DUF1990 family protein [Microbacteriaceae bacterium]
MDALPDWATHIISLELDRPADHRITVRSAVIGRGIETFDRSGESLLTWGLQRGSGFRAVHVPPRVTVGATTIWRIPFGPLKPRTICEVFAVADEPTRVGFGHVALPGHPQQGWENFVVTLEPDETVVLTITVCAKPAVWWMSLAGPAGVLALHVLLARNLRALTGEARPIAHSQ